MSISPQELAQRVLGAEWEKLSLRSRGVIEKVLARGQVSKDSAEVFARPRSFGERLADRIASFGGSWRFILIFLAILGAWVAANTVLVTGDGRAFDPYPFILLNLFLSMIAALQAPVIMMSQNRLAMNDRLQASHDYEVNLKAEIEIRQLHDKLDVLRDEDWRRLVELQQRQLELLTRILENTNQRPS